MPGGSNIGAGAASGAAVGAFGGPVGSLIGAGIGAIASIFGAKIGSSGAQKAAQIEAEAARQRALIEAQTAREALAYQQEKDRQEQELYKAAQLGSYQQWAAREGRLAPYRGFGESATNTLGNLLGIAPSPVAAPPPPPSQLLPTGGLGSLAGYATTPPAASGANMPELQDYFFSLLPNQNTLTPDQLKALGPQLAEKGISLRPNAAGVVGKIQLPNGTVVDVIQGAASGVNKPQWLLPNATSTASAPLHTMPWMRTTSPLPFRSTRPTSLTLADFL